VDADGVDVGRLTRTADHRRRVGKRPAVRRTIAREPA